MDLSLRRRLFNLFRAARQPGLILPFALIAPVVSVAGYGLRLSDIVIILLGGYFAVTVAKGVRLPKFVVVFFIMWTAAWALANINGLQYGVNFDLSDFNFFYRLLFLTAALLIGLLSTESIDRVFNGPFAVTCYFAILGICVFYYFAGEYDRVQLLKPFVVNYQRLGQHVQSWQFPGLGNGRNSYTASILMVFIFTFYRAFRYRRGYIVPLALAAVIMFSGGRRAIAQLVFDAFVIIFYVSVLAQETRALYFHGDGLAVRRERIPQLLALFLFVVGGGVALSQVKIGEQVGMRFVILVSDTRTGESGIVRRLINMQGGLDRIAVAPVLGVPRVRGADKAFPHILEFSYPHNEFLVIWMFFGLLGLSAFLYLLSALFYLNYKYHLDIRWPLAYFGIIVQMLVDIAFFDYQIATILFLIIGLNVREIRRKATAGHYRVQPAPGSPVPVR